MIVAALWSLTSYFVFLSFSFYLSLVDCRAVLQLFLTLFFTEPPERVYKSVPSKGTSMVNEKGRPLWDDEE